MSHIRRLSAGPDYKGGAMHYVVGQGVLKNSHTIEYILKSNEGYIVYIKESKPKGAVIPWKFISSTMPVTIEYFIDF